MILGDWRCGGRRRWTEDEIRETHAMSSAGLGASAMWRSGRLPCRSEGAIRAQLRQRGLWGQSRPR